MPIRLYYREISLHCFIPCCSTYGSLGLFSLNDCGGRRPFNGRLTTFIKTFYGNLSRIHLRGKSLMATSELREAWRCELNTHCGSATSKGITIQRIPLRDTGGADWRVSVKAVTPVAVRTNKTTGSRPDVNRHLIY
jgi:hypothetical protein